MLNQVGADWKMRLSDLFAKLISLRGGEAPVFIDAHQS